MMDDESLLSRCAERESQHTTSTTYAIARLNRNTRRIARSKITSTANNNSDSRIPCGTQVHTQARSADGLDNTTDNRTGAIAKMSLKPSEF